MSLGDVTVAGIGTTTFVCQGQAVAFGHPFNWTGQTTMAARAADTITIVKDPIFGSYKLANVAEGVGTVTQDRLAGIVATLGADAPASPVTSTVTDLDSGRTRQGASYAVFPDFLPFLAFEHLFQNIDVTIDRVGQGSSAVDYTISGTRDGGRTWELTRSTRYASRFDISFDSILELSFTAEVLQAFDGEDITVTSIDVPKQGARVERLPLRPAQRGQGAARWDHPPSRRPQAGPPDRVPQRRPLAAGAGERAQGRVRRGARRRLHLRGDPVLHRRRGMRRRRRARDVRRAPAGLPQPAARRRARRPAPARREGGRPRDHDEAAGRGRGRLAVARVRARPVTG
jgi:hypothetical protein